MYIRFPLPDSTSQHQMGYPISQLFGKAGADKITDFRDNLTMHCSLERICIPDSQSGNKSAVVRTNSSTLSQDPPSLFIPGCKPNKYIVESRSQSRSSSASKFMPGHRRRHGEILAIYLSICGRVFSSPLCRTAVS